jgi:hypothetical protein
MLLGGIAFFAGLLPRCGEDLFEPAFRFRLTCERLTYAGLAAWRRRRLFAR